MKPMFRGRQRLVIFDADGTLVDAFHAVDIAFAHHDMDIGDFERFQKRRKLLKYLGGLREFPKNLRQQFDKHNRKELVRTLTEVYREEGRLYEGMDILLQKLIAMPDIKVGIVTRNVTLQPEVTLGRILARHDVDIHTLDFVECLSLKEDKRQHFRAIRQLFDINPAHAYACGDEYRDYEAAVGAGMHPFISAYGFENYERLRDGFDIPEEVIARTPAQLAGRLSHAVDCLPVP